MRVYTKNGVFLLVITGASLHGVTLASATAAYARRAAIIFLIMVAPVQVYLFYSDDLYAVLPCYNLLMAAFF